MRELLLLGVAVALSGWLGWNLGVRTERGRHSRIAEIEQQVVEQRRGGVRLSRIVVRR